jgi:3-deoxy-manno-octulosonate cytidylyltransferase (CMP-KDO synthetase)
LSKTKIAAIIPARMGSSRYPGKPLLDIEGLPMIEHVRRRALLCHDFSEVVVATCDNEIFEIIRKFGGDVVMTSSDHTMASDRIAEVAHLLECSHVVNVQGDEILTMPEDLTLMTNAIKNNPTHPYFSAIAIIENKDELCDKNIVKCVLTNSEKIIYCSRNISQFYFGDNFEPIRKLLGVFAYKREDLFEYGRLKRTSLEIKESIDILRIIENDLPMESVLFTCGYPGINDPQEELVIRGILKKDVQQNSILEKILSF